MDSNKNKQDKIVLTMGSKQQQIKRSEWVNEEVMRDGGWIEVETGGQDE